MSCYCFERRIFFHFLMVNLLVFILVVANGVLMLKIGRIWWHFSSSKFRSIQNLPTHLKENRDKKHGRRKEGEWREKMVWAWTNYVLEEFCLAFSLSLFRIALQREPFCTSTWFRYPNLISGDTSCEEWNCKSDNFVIVIW